MVLMPVGLRYGLEKAKGLAGIYRLRAICLSSSRRNMAKVLKLKGASFDLDLYGVPCSFGDFGSGNLQELWR